MLLWMYWPWCRMMSLLLTCYYWVTDLLLTCYYWVTDWVTDIANSRDAIASKNMHILWSTNLKYITKFILTVLQIFSYQPFFATCISLLGLFMLLVKKFLWKYSFKIIIFIKMMVFIFIIITHSITFMVFRWFMMVVRWFLRTENYFPKSNIARV